MKKNAAKEKSYLFALEIIKLSRKLTSLREYVLSTQVLKSGTSIGANVEEVQGAQSRRDFRAKIFIAYKEARETRYWIRLIRDSGLVDDVKANALLDINKELCKLLGKTLSTSKKNY
jgi:four helix bundle protein